MNTSRNGFLGGMPPQGGVLCVGSAGDDAAGALLHACYENGWEA